MNKLRPHSRLGKHLVRLVLAWFVLAMGVAVASPLVNPQELQLVCSAGAMKLLVKTADGSEATTGHKLECPMCATVGAPPPANAEWAPLAQPLGHVTQPVPAARLAALVGAPLPARGPPSL